MIKDYAKYEIGRMTVEVNYDESVKPCQKVKFTFEGVVEEIERSDLYAMLVLFGDDQQQEDLLKVTQTQMKPIRRMFKIKATKDLKAGEFLQFPFTYYVPLEAYDKAITEKNAQEVQEGAVPTFPELVNKEK